MQAVNMSTGLHRFVPRPLILGLAIAMAFSTAVLAQPAPGAPAPVAPAASSAEAPASAAVPPASSEAAGPALSPGTPAIAVAALPRDLSPWGMFLNADILVKLVMIGLLFASLVTWTVWLAKNWELWVATRKARAALAVLNE